LDSKNKGIINAYVQTKVLYKLHANPL